MACTRLYRLIRADEACSTHRIVSTPEVSPVVNPMSCADRSNLIVPLVEHKEQRMHHSGHYSTSAAVADCPGDLKRPTVLTIDDDPNVLQAIQRGFRRYNINLLQAYHGAHGIWLATTQEPDLIITDVRMPLSLMPFLRVRVVCVLSSGERKRDCSRMLQ